MRSPAILEELIGLAQRQGLAVRREAMTRGVSSGGMCVLKGTPTVFVDDRASVDVQIEVLATVLRRFDLSTVFVHPALKSLLGVNESESDGGPPGQGSEPAPAR